MKLVIAARAEREIQRKAASWEKHSTVSPGLFWEETRLLEMLRGRGYDGSIGTLRRYVRRVRPRRAAEAFFRLTTLPGEQAQVDWGSFGGRDPARTQVDRVTVSRQQRVPVCASTVATEKRQMFSAAENSEVPWCGFAGALVAADAVPAANTSAMMYAHAIQGRRHMAWSLRAKAAR